MPGAHSRREPDEPRATVGGAAADDSRDDQAASSPSTGGLNPAAAWHAARSFLDAAKDFATAMGGLLRSELSLARAAWPWVIALSVLLVGLSVSLWLSMIALAGWGLYVLTDSVGWALLVLVVAHVVLLLLAHLALKRSALHMTLPETRSEVHDLLTRASSRP